MKPVLTQPVPPVARCNRLRQRLRNLKNSLRGRLLLSVSLWILLSVAVAGWTLSDLFRDHASKQLASELNVHLNQLTSALSFDEQGTLALRMEPTDPRLQRPLSGLYWQVDRLEPGHPTQIGVLRSRSLWDQLINTEALPTDLEGQELRALQSSEGQHWIGVARNITPVDGSANYRLTIAAHRQALEKPLAEFTTLLVIALGLLALAMTLACVLLLLFGLRPLERVRLGLTKVRSGQSDRLEGEFPSEISPLVMEFNQALQENNQVVQQARTLAGNLAHALKTPLTILANSAREQSSPFATLVTEQVDLASRQVNHHLARARAAAVSKAPGHKTPVAPVITSMVAVLQKLYATKGVHMDIAMPNDELTFRGDRQDFQEILGNLLDNACKWARHQVWISAATQQDQMFSLAVDDDGPGLSTPEQYESVFERGVRMDQRVPGSGLGLAIVRDLVTTYGGQVHAEPSPHGGLRVVLTLPRHS